MRLPNHPYKTIPLVCLAAVAAVIMPGDSSLIWAAGAVFAFAGPVLALFEGRPSSALHHE